MGWFALITAMAAAVCVALPAHGMYLAVGTGAVAIALGAMGYRRRQASAAARLAGSGAVVLGVAAVVLGATRYGLMLAAIEQLRSLFSP